MSYYSEIYLILFSLILKGKRFFLDICRRLSLLRWGYSSPPFIIVQLPRRNLTWRLFHFYYDFRQTWSSPISGLLDREITKDKGIVNTTKTYKLFLKKSVYSWFQKFLYSMYFPNERMDISDNGEKHYAFYLRPDRLRWSTWGIGVLLGLILLCFGHHWMAFFMLLWMGFGVQFLTFRIRRIPVLNEVWTAWPKSMDKWLIGIPQSGYDSRYRNDSKMQKTRRFFTHCLPAIREKKDLVFWMPTGSVQEAFIRAAVVDHFIGLKSSELITNKTVFRWVIDWLFPIWGSLLSLFAFAIYCIVIYNKYSLFPNCPTLISQVTTNKIILTCLSIIWYIYTILFLWRQSQTIYRWCRLDLCDILALPAAVRRLISPSSTEINRVWDKFRIGMQTTIQSIFFIFFLTLAQILSI